MVKLGFTGTRKGMTPQQKTAFLALLEMLRPDAFHMGDCIGADDDAANIAHEFRLRPRIISHPPLDETLRAFNPHADETRPAKTHFARNRDIVIETDALVGAPCDMTLLPYGGTSYTINFARKQRSSVFIIWPDGSVLLANGTTQPSKDAPDA